MTKTYTRTLTYTPVQHGVPGINGYYDVLLKGHDADDREALTPQIRYYENNSWFYDELIDTVAYNVTHWAQDVPLKESRRLELPMEGRK